MHILLLFSYLLADKTELVAYLLTIWIDIQPNFTWYRFRMTSSVFLLLPFWRAHNTDIEILGILAHNYEIDIFRGLILERRPDTFKEFHRAQVDILIEIEAYGKKNTFSSIPVLFSHHLWPK